MKSLKKAEKKNEKIRISKSRKDRLNDLERVKEELRKLLESSGEMEANLSPKARALLEESREIRRRVGPVPFKVRDLIREIRDK